MVLLHLLGPSLLGDLRAAPGEGGPGELARVPAGQLVPSRGGARIAKLSSEPAASGGPGWRLPGCVPAVPLFAPVVATGPRAAGCSLRSPCTPAAAPLAAGRVPVPDGEPGSDPVAARHACRVPVGHICCCCKCSLLTLLSMDTRRRIRAAPVAAADAAAAPAAAAAASATAPGASRPLLGALLTALPGCESTTEPPLQLPVGVPGASE